MGKQPVRALLDTEFAGEWGEGSAGSGLCECRVLRATNLTSNGIDYSTAAQRFVPEAKVEMKRLRRGDLILEAAGGGPGVPVGRVARFDPPDEEWTYLVSNFFRTLRPGPSADCRFAFHVLDDLYQQPRIWQIQQQTTGIINLKVRDYLQLRVSVPPLEEQRRIAQVLDTIDETIQATERVIAKQKTLRIGLTSDQFDGVAGSPNWEPGELNALTAVGSTSRSAARSEVFLRDCGHWLSGGTPDTGTPGYWGGEIPWITASSLKGRYLSQSKRTLTPAGAEAGSRIVPRHTILFVVRGMSLKKEFRVGMAIRPVAFGQDCKALVPADGVEPKYLLFALEAAESRVLRMVDEASHGTGRLQMPLLGSLKLWLPPLEEQRRIVEIIESIDEIMLANEGRLAKLRRMRSGLAADLLSGRVRTVAA